MQRYDLIIVGGGIIGLATAYAAVKRRKGIRVLVLEKEEAIAEHQSSHNSGVVHSGIYYKPGSLKATMCRRGRALLSRYCDHNNIPFRTTGKLVLATHKREIEALQALQRRGLANGVECEMLTPARIRDVEPHAQGEMALHVADTAVVDFKRVCQSLAQRAIAHDTLILTSSELTAIKANADEIAVSTTNGDFVADHLVNCAGLHADRVVRLAGERPGLNIVPFRGEYVALKPEAEGLVRAIIDPIPEPDSPFDGPRLIRRLDGTVEIGPTVSLAASREGYSRRGLSLGDAAATLTSKGFGAMALTRRGAVRSSSSRGAFLKRARRLVPGVEKGNLAEHRTGVRAQALAPNGALVEDFTFLDTERATHALNVPSPDATAALAIADHILSRVPMG